MRTYLITQPDDWHVHFRDQKTLSYTVPATAAHFSRALIMPNLQPALTSISALNDYYKRIIEACPDQFPFKPYLTLYLNEQVSPDTFLQMKNYPYILGAKLYPAGATTNSEEGVRSIHALYPLFDAMQTHDLVLQIHGEVTQGDVFEREAQFIETWLKPLTQQFPALRIVLEHISTRAAVDFVTQASQHVAATITPHHLLYNRNHMLVGGIRPHYYCLPILKREEDQVALQLAATSGNNKFFAGTDSAPHAQTQKENACGCAGMYTAPYALSMYAQVFDFMGKMDKLNDFMSKFGAKFYHLPVNDARIELIQKPQTIPLSLPFVDGAIIPAGAGNTLSWSIHETS